MNPGKGTEARIGTWLAESKKHPGGAQVACESRDLFLDGWLDSLASLRLLQFLESEFSVRIPPLRLTRQNLSTVASLAALVESSRD